ncbi:sugar ABC transporter [Bacillus cereus]|nr:sugar ABC transporter [Bacillus cereus]MDA2572733.1 sugar ABC transporter [Bacillus cereus]
MEEEKWPQEPRGNIPLLDPCTFYHANLIWRKQGYKNKMLKRYVVQSKGTHCMFWHDEKRKKPCGCFPAHWFAEFKELKEDEETQQQEFLPFLERADGQLTFFLNLNFVQK